MMDLRGTAALVTGGGTGLGRVISLALAREGVHVAVNYTRSEKEANGTADEIRNHGVEALTIRADVSQPADAQGMVERVAREFGRLDVLINNAGRTVFVPFPDLEAVSVEDWDAIMAVDVRGPRPLPQAGAPGMQRAGEGRPPVKPP